MTDVSAAAQRDRDLALLALVEVELDDVQQALQRLTDGTYGTCEVCGSAISDDRLELHPATRCCVHHQG